VTVAVVVPTLGRPSLAALLDSLAAARGPRPDQVVLVDDRPVRARPLLDGDQARTSLVTVLRSDGRGPAAARNLGWQAVSADWVAFLDDDVVVSHTWLADLYADLTAAPDAVAGVQGVVDVPLPAHRRPTDWERNTAGLATARWITADMAYRRRVLGAVGGFDERFPRAFREDADLALRVQDAGWRLQRGRRRIIHPVRPASWHASVRAQRGNADDALMRRRHGRGWKERAGAGRGRLAGHGAVTATGLIGVIGARTGHRYSAALAATAWTLGTVRFTWARIAPGPRDRAEVFRMLATSVLIPPCAMWHRARGTLAHRRAGPWVPRRVEAVLVDRDGTLVHDVPYNGDPARVTPMPQVGPALDRLRAAGLRVGVITNQSGMGRGRLTAAAVTAVNTRIEHLLGPFATWQVCPHASADGCRCRKPEPGLIHAAADALGVPVERCVVIGDIGSDVRAAAAAGAFGVLVPTRATEPDEIRAAPVVQPTFAAAAELLLSRSGP
jgi:histidinol-phosphate phosphatase family protein